MKYPTISLLAVSASLALISCNGSGSSDDDPGGFPVVTSEAPTDVGFFFDGPRGSEIQFKITEMNFPNDPNELLMKLNPDQTGVLELVGDSEFPGFPITFLSYNNVAGQGNLDVRLGSFTSPSGSLARLNDLLADQQSDLRQVFDDFVSQNSQANEDALEQAFIDAGLVEICIDGRLDPQSGQPTLIIFDTATLSWTDGVGTFICREITLNDSDGDFAYELGEELSDTGSISDLVIRSSVRPQG